MLLVNSNKDCKNEFNRYVDTCVKIDKILQKVDTYKDYEKVKNSAKSEMIKKNERVYYFINADVNFIIDGEKVHCESGDVLYLDKNTNYSAEGDFEAVTINVPAFGVIKDN